MKFTKLFLALAVFLLVFTSVQADTYSFGSTFTLTNGHVTYVLTRDIDCQSLTVTPDCMIIEGSDLAGTYCDSSIENNTINFPKPSTTLPPTGGGTSGGVGSNTENTSLFGQNTSSYALYNSYTNWNWNADIPPVWTYSITSPILPIVSCTGNNGFTCLVTASKITIAKDFSGINEPSATSVGVIHIVGQDKSYDLNVSLSYSNPTIYWPTESSVPSSFMYYLPWLFRIQNQHLIGFYSLPWLAVLGLSIYFLFLRRSR